MSVWLCFQQYQMFPHGVKAILCQELMFVNEIAVSANERLDRDDDVRCTQDFSDFLPLENGEVIFSLIKGASNFWSSPSLQAWTKASHIRIRRKDFTWSFDGIYGE